MTQTIWVARHGTREDFLDPTWRLRAKRPFDPALSRSGHQQAQELAHRLQDQPVDLIFASPFYRTLQTASYSASTLGLSLRPEWGIAEHLLELNDDPDIITSAEAVVEFPHLDQQHVSVLRPTYPESTEVACGRAATAVRVLADQYSGQNLLFVSHATIVVGIVRQLANIQRRINVPVCSLFELRRQAAGWELVREADISHLSDKPLSLRHAWGF